MAEALRVLILDDEPKLAKVLARVLSREGHAVESVSDPAEAVRMLGESRFDLLVTDLKMPGASGIDVMRAARERDPEIDVVLMTAFASVETAVQALKAGASDYLIKPFHNDELVVIASRIAERRGLAQENRALRQSLAPKIDRSRIVAAGPAMREVLKRAEKVAASDVSVLLMGESGVGKEVLATLIQSSGARAKKPFIAVNCGALPETLLESELFGHVRGAFTGAVETRKGVFQAADTGTIFLDEIGEISPALQVKLLRVLQSGEFQRVGDPQTFRADVRVLAATNRPLEELVERGEFRSDLYYRLNVVPIVIPPLRERREDVPALVDHFLLRLRSSTGKAKTLSPEAFDLLMRYSWPGNIRELENALEHAFVLGDGDEIREADLPSAIRNQAAGGPSSGTMRRLDGCTLEEIEKKMLHEALVSTGFNHTRAAAKLGITRRTLGYRIEKYGLPRKGGDGR